METAQDFELDSPDEDTAALLANMQRSAALKPADQRYVRFYLRSKKDVAKSAAEGRPIFKSVEYVEVLTPGDKDTIVDRPVRKVDRYAWREKYLAFKRGTVVSEGMPLSQWGGVPPERVEELAYFKVRTVEQLADVPDSNLPNLGRNSRAEREKARAYLQVMAGQEPFRELKSENDELKKRLEALEALANKQQVKPQTR